MKTVMFQIYTILYSNQIRLKFLKKNIYYNVLIKAIQLSTKYVKLESLKTLALLESFYYLKLISNKKVFISYFKKKYKELDISIQVNILKKNSDYFFILFSIFFLPMILKKEPLFNTSFLHNKFLNLTVNSYNFYPFIPNVYFS